MDPQVKGLLFLQVFDQVEMKWGRNGAEAVGSGGIDPESWYPICDFCALLNNVKGKLGNNNPLFIYMLGFRTMKDDPAWRQAFESMNPTNVFLSTERQETLYRVGTQTALPIGAKHVRVEVASPDCDPAWYEFYRGRLQGVLELTGRTGVVHLLPATGEGCRKYDIKWG